MGLQQAPRQTVDPVDLGEPDERAEWEGAALEDLETGVDERGVNSSSLVGLVPGIPCPVETVEKGRHRVEVAQVGEARDRVKGSRVEKLECRDAVSRRVDRVVGFLPVETRFGILKGP